MMHAGNQDQKAKEAVKSLRLLGIAIPGSLSFQCTQDLGGAEFSL